MKIALRPALDILDLDGWRSRVQELRAESAETAGHAAGLELAEEMVDILEAEPAESRTETR